MATGGAFITPHERGKRSTGNGQIDGKERSERAHVWGGGGGSFLLGARGGDVDLLTRRATAAIKASRDPKNRSEKALGGVVGGLRGSK